MSHRVLLTCRARQVSRPFEPADSFAGTRRLLLKSLGALAAGGWSVRAAHAQSAAPALLMMAGAGYKRPMEAICQAFTQTTGVTVERSYGNLQQVFAQAKASGRVDVLVGDADFIDKANQLNVPHRTPLGKGVMAMVWRAGLGVKPGLSSLSPLDAVRTLLGDAALSVSMPNPSRPFMAAPRSNCCRPKGCGTGCSPGSKWSGPCRRSVRT